MSIISIKQLRSGKNIHFITDEFNEYSLDDILSQGEKGVLENVTIVSTKSGKKYLRSKPNQNEKDNLENFAITCWGFVATPLKQISGEPYGRGDFFIHGGLIDGTAGCIEITSVDLNQKGLNFPNAEFHCFLRLYKRNFKLIVKYQ
jgi:hypothetical protein